MKMALAIVTMVTTTLASFGGVALVRADTPDTGKLSVAVSSPPPQAAIFIDDAGLRDPSGKQLYTPQTVVLPVGSHQLLLKTDDGKTTKLRFSIAKGATTSLSLQPK
jgi:hypothetical protein